MTESEALELGREAATALAALQARGRIEDPWAVGMPVLAVMADDTVSPDVGVVIEVDRYGMPLVYWPNLDDRRGSDQWGRHVRAHQPTPGGHLIPAVREKGCSGFLLALVREAWGRPDLCVRASRDGRQWWPDCIGTPNALLSIREASEPHALVSALRAAPRSTP